MPVRSNAVDRGPSTVGSLDIGLLRQSADQITSVARHPGLAGRPGIGGTLLQIAGHLNELAGILEDLDLPR
jgi:hypothetical protein